MNLGWGILGTGRIARTFAAAVEQSTANKLIAVGSRDQQGAQDFAKQFPAVREHCHDSYAALLDDPAVQAIYVATPHDSHAHWTIKALNAGKHVLCEKPMALNHAQTMAMVEAARRNQCFLMEAFMYQLHPQTIELKQLLDQGAIGELRHIDATFGYHAPFNADSRLFANELAGGGIMDVGCYPMSFARIMADGEPLDIAAQGRLGATGVDEWSTALLKFDNGLAAQIGTAVSLNMHNTATLYGSEGRIEIPQPWLPGVDDGHWSFELHKGAEVETISGVNPGLWTIEAEHVAECIAAGRLESPVISWQNSLDNALALDKWRQAIGLTYQQETPAGHPGPLLGELTVHPRIHRGQVPQLNKPVSRLVMGCDNQPSMSHAVIMWDHFFESGGNCFDTAHIYGQGTMESLLGHWHTQRNLREEIVIIGKGAHTPDNFPDRIAPQLDISLNRLQTDYVDLYFLHRDNLEIPVEAFIEALNAEVARGRIRAFGGSNWSLERVKAANDYAKSRGLQGFSAISNQFSLARMCEQIWPGTESASDSAFIDYLTESQIALMPWSSQARGFFTPWADQVIADQGKENTVVTTMQPTIAELTRVWFSAENFARRERAGELAARYDVPMINIALAYVLQQPFPTFPLIGPRVVNEIESCIEALDLQLSDAEFKYLESG